MYYTAMYFFLQLAAKEKFSCHPSICLHSQKLDFGFGMMTKVCYTYFFVTKTEQKDYKIKHGSIIYLSCYYQIKGAVELFEHVRAVKRIVN